LPTGRAREWGRGEPRRGDRRRRNAPWRALPHVTERGIDAHHPGTLRAKPHPAQNLARRRPLRHPTLMPPRPRALRYGASGALSAALALLPSCDKGRGVVSLSATSSAKANTEPHPEGPRLGAVAMTAPIFANPDKHSAKLGYLRA